MTSGYRQNLASKVENNGCCGGKHTNVAFRLAMCGRLRLFLAKQRHVREPGNCNAHDNQANGAEIWSI